MLETTLFGTRRSTACSLIAMVVRTMCLLSWRRVMAPMAFSSAHGQVKILLQILTSNSSLLISSFKLQEQCRKNPVTDFAVMPYTCCNPRVSVNPVTDFAGVPYTCCNFHVTVKRCIN